MNYLWYQTLVERSHFLLVIAPCLLLLILIFLFFVFPLKICSGVFRGRGNLSSQKSLSKIAVLDLAIFMSNITVLDLTIFMNTILYWI